MTHRFWLSFRRITCSQSHRRLQAILFALLFTAVAVNPASAGHTTGSFDGEIIETSDTDWAHGVTVYDYADGRRLVWVDLDAFPINCPDFTYNCRIESRWLVKRTSLDLNWDQVGSIRNITDHANDLDLWACANGVHHWRFQTRLRYQVKADVTTEEIYYGEASASGNLETSKVVVKAGGNANVNGNITRRKTVSAPSLSSQVTDWEDVLDPSGGITTRC